MANTCCVFSVLALVFVFSKSQLTKREDGSFGYTNIETGEGNATLFNITLESPEALKVDMYGFIIATFNLTVYCEATHSKFVLRTRCQDTHVAGVAKRKSQLIGCENITNAKAYIRKQIKVELDGVIIGRTNITFQLTPLGTDESISFVDIDHAQNGTWNLIYVYPVTVLRVMRPVDYAFRVIIYIFLIVSTIGFGVKLDLQVVKECLKKPIAPIIGFVCQFGFMPTIAYGIAKLVVPNDPMIALGIFVAGCCPGGGVSNIYTFLLKGDISLSITMTSISNIAALGMIPLWVYTLGVTFVHRGTTLNIPFANIAAALAVLIIPLFIGLLIKFKCERVAKIVVKIIKPVSVIAVLLLVTIGIYSNLYVFSLFKPNIVFAGCLLPYIGYTMGGVAAAIARQPWSRIKTIAIETGLQNTGIAIVLLMFSFPSPDGELAAIAAIASALMTPLPLFVITIPYLIYNKCKERKYSKVPITIGEIKNGDISELVEDKLTAI